MMKKIILLLLVLLISSCSKKGITPARVKLNVAALMDTRTGIGSGGAILFGKSAAGETFAQVVATSEENVELANGTWSFYALMWDNPNNKLSGTVYCAKPSSQTLSGTDATVSLNLTNADCTDSAYSNAGLYTDANSKIRFSDVYLEECDEIKATTSHTCGLGNRGSALSYKVVFNSYKKSTAGAMSFGSGEIASSCIKADRGDTGIISNALPINIPNGSPSLSIPVAIKMYPGNDECNDSDPKGSFVVNLDQGVGAKSQNGQIVAYNPNNCAIDSSVLMGTNPGEDREKCEALMGQMSSNYCNFTSIPSSITKFAPSAICAPIQTGTTGSSVSGGTAVAVGTTTTINATASTNGSVSGTLPLIAVYPAVKHLVAIPKDALCAKYLGQSTMIGTNPFAGGNGSEDRPFKICTEWQINQIGAPEAPAAFSLSSYKLMNDLDMNLVDIGGKNSTNVVYTKPGCAFAGHNTTPGDLDNYHNFNPLDKIVGIDCTGISTLEQSQIGFTGVFNGNGKTISNARIFGRNVDVVGFVRKLGSKGTIRDLNFNFLMVQAKSYVGGVAGLVSGPDSLIKNIKIDRANISADARNNQNSGSSGNTNIYVGAVVGKMSALTFVENVQITNSNVRGGDYVAGLVGDLSGKISKSSFRGDVRQDGNPGVYSAGIAASISSTGKVDQSFSEGFLEGDTQFMGGIAGYVDGVVDGVVDRVVEKSYSNMIINLKNNKFNVSGTDDYYIGGLFGFSHHGSITDVYFGGLVKIQNSGKSGTSYNAVIGGQSGTFNISNCVSSETQAVNVNCTKMQNSQLRSGTITQLSQAGFNQRAGRLPHLLWETWETNPCMNPVSVKKVADQATAGRGSITNPIVICNSIQLSNISDRSSSEHYHLGDDISLENWTSSSFISTLNGKLHGNGRTLYDLNVFLTAETKYFSIIGTLETIGQIDNLNLVQMKLVGTDRTSLGYAGLLTSINNGLIANINATDVSLNSNAPTTGIIAAMNSGTILQTKISRSDLKARSVGGSIAGVASPTSIINKAEVEGSVALNTRSGPTPSLGGVVGKNEGSIDQVRYSGEVNSVINQALASDSTLGGISGLNNGTISNAIVENWSEIKSKMINYAGGIAGKSTGRISKTLNLGKVISYDDPTFTQSALFAPVAYSGSTGTMDDSYFMENMIGTYLGSPGLNAMSVLNQTSGTPNFGKCETSYSPIFSYLDASTPSNADLFFYENNGGSSLRNMTSISALTALSSGGSYSTGTYPNGGTQTGGTQTGGTQTGGTQTGGTQAGGTQAGTYATPYFVVSYIPFQNQNCMSPSSYASYYKKLILPAIYAPGQMAPAEFRRIESFPNFNIAGKTSAGVRVKEVELIGFFKSMMYNQAPPANAPIWQLDGDDRPSLVQVNPFN